MQFYSLHYYDLMGFLFLMVVLNGCGPLEAPPHQTDLVLLCCCYVHSCCTHRHSGSLPVTVRSAVSLYFELIFIYLYDVFELLHIIIILFTVALNLCTCAHAALCLDLSKGFFPFWTVNKSKSPGYRFFILYYLGF